MAFETEARWEFCAPHYHDFQLAETPEAEIDVDAWFESTATKGLTTPVSLHGVLRTTNAAAKNATDAVASEEKEKKSGDDSGAASGSALKASPGSPLKHTNRSPFGVAKAPNGGFGSPVAAGKQNNNAASADASARRRAADAEAIDAVARLLETNCSYESDQKIDTSEHESVQKGGSTSVQKSAGSNGGFGSVSKLLKPKSDSKSPSTQAAFGSVSKLKSGRKSIVKSSSKSTPAAVHKIKIGQAVLPAPSPTRSSPRRAAAAAARKAIEEASDSPLPPQPSPVRQSPRLLAAAAAKVAEDVGSTRPVLRAPAMGATSKTPSRLAKCATFADAMCVDAVPAVDTVPAAATETEAPSAEFVFAPKRKGLVGGGAVRVLIDLNNAAVVDDLVDDEEPNPDNLDTTPSCATPSTYGTPALFGVSTRGAGGASSMPSSFPSTSRSHSLATHSNAGSRPNTSGAPRRSRRLHPIAKDLTVPVSPALTRGGFGKRGRDTGLTTEEILYAQSLRFAAEEKAKRRRVEGARDRLNAPTVVSKPKTGRAVPVAFGGRVTAPVGSSNRKDNTVGFNFKPVTIPTSPLLSRPDRFFKPPGKTTEQLEIEKLATLPKFKARKLRSSVMRGDGDAAEKARVASLQRREMTTRAGDAKPKPLAAAVGRKRSREELEELETQTARDAKRVRDEWGDVAPTFAQSPKFATTRRAVLRAPPNPVPAPQTSLAVGKGARRVAASDVDHDHLRRHQAFEKKGARVDGITQLVPFSLQTDRRGDVSRFDLERAVDQQRQRELTLMKGVKSKPVPKTSSGRRRSQLPPPNFKPPTQVEPFHLKGEALHAYAQRQLSLRVAEEESVSKNAAKGVAAKNPPPTTFRSVFTVQPSRKPLTAPIDEVGVAGSRRAEERERFDSEVAHNARVRETQEAELARVAAIDEAKNRKTLRKSTQFKAAPMPDYTALASLGVAPIRGEKTLTRPESPEFATTRRASRWG